MAAKTWLMAPVKWTGLTQMVFDLQHNVQKRLRRSCNEMTKDMLGMVHRIYVENLSGTRPSTATRPLPVGMRTRMLVKSARIRQINQYAGEVVNDARHAGWIELGTYKLVARRPLGDAVDEVRGMVPGRMDDAIREISPAEVIRVGGRWTWK